MVRIGTTANQRKLFYQLQKEKEELERLGFDPTPKQIGGRLGVPEKDVITMEKRMSGKDISLDQPLSDSDSATLMDLQSTPEENLVDDQIALLEQIRILKDKVDELRADLNEKELFILENRLLSDSPLTLQEIGDKYKVTREAVRQLEAKLIGKIKKSMSV